MSLTLYEFLNNSSLHNVWLKHNDYLSVYVRKATRIVNGSKVRTLDIANIEVDTYMRGQGFFTVFLREAEIAVHATQFNANPSIWLDGIFVESILNPRLHAFLLKKGYTDVPNTYPPCVYKAL